MRLSTGFSKACRIAVPVGLIGVGVTLLVGCIYVPSSYRYQTTGAPRPEVFIGRNESVQLGKTKLVDALISLYAHQAHLAETISTDINPYAFEPHEFYGPAQLSNDGQAVAICYHLRTGTTYALFCGTLNQWRDRYLILDIAPGNVVVATHTLSLLPANRFGPANEPVEAISKRFDDEDRRRLSAAGIAIEWWPSRRPATDPTSAPASLP